MKTAAFVAMVIAAITSIPLFAQDVQTNAQRRSSASAGGAQVNESSSGGASADATGVKADERSDATGKTTYAPAATDWGNDAASHAWEMSSITGELQGNLDSKTAKAGDRVVLKTTEKVQTSDGTVIPGGSRLVGHVTAVQAQDREHAASQMAIAFDHAELKKGENVKIYTLIRSVRPGPSATAMSSMEQDEAITAPIGRGGMAGGMSGGPSMGTGRGGGVPGGAAGTLNGVGNAAGGTLERTSAAAGGLGGQASTELDSRANSGVQTAGHGDLNVASGAHAAAAERAIPHPTGIPGVMLAGTDSASGVFSASKSNVQFASGTEMQLGIVADK